ADTPMGPRPDLRRMLVPLGPVAVFGASNFPLAFSVPGGDTASALAAGCPVVAKAHSSHPATSQLCYAIMVRALREAGAPDGVLGIVYGQQAGAALVRHPVIRAVGYTPSLGGGRFLLALASSPTPPILSPRPHPLLRRARQYQPARRHPGSGCRPGTGDRRRNCGLLHPGRGPVLHEAGAGLPPRRCGRKTGGRGYCRGRSRAAARG